MGLFKSKEEKAMEQKILVRRTINNINKYIKQLEKKKDEYITLAKSGVKEGDKGQAKLAISGLKIVMSQEKMAKRVKMSMDLAMQMRDLTGMTASFLDGMSSLSKEMGKTAKNMEFLKVQKEFQNAMMGVESTTESLDLMMQESDSMFEGLAANDEIDDKEINDLINIQATQDENAIDKEIEEKLKEIQKTLLGE